MSTAKGTPYVVSIIVYGAKGLKPKKDKHKFCVIYGIGKTKFRTDVVEDLFDNPVFNKETEVTVDRLDQELKFKVTEKHEKDVLGQVIVQLDELGDHNTSSPHKVPLRPHKKCPTPHGLLIFEAWITAKKIESISSRSTSMESLRSIKSLGLSSGLKKLKERMTVSSKSSSDKNKKNASETLFSLKTRNAISCQDVTRESQFYIPADRRSLHSDIIDPYDGPDTTSELSDDYQKRNSFNLGKVSEFIGPKPEVTSVSPKSGPETGGTVVTIRGSNLGQSQEDIVVLNICGADVLDTLEYISPWKLQCKTVPWNPCVGGIIVETLSGGRGPSLVEFTFSEVERPKTLTGDKYSLNNAHVVSDITEPDESGFEDVSSLNGVGFAVSYSDSQVNGNSFNLGVHEMSSDSWITPSAETLHEIEEDGNLRYSVGKYNEEMTSNIEPQRSSSLNERDLRKREVRGETSETQSDLKNAESVSKEVFKREIENSPKHHAEIEKYQMDTPDGNSSKENRAQHLVQINVIPPVLDTELVPEKLDSRSAVSSGAPVRQPPRVVEIQPMRNGDSLSSSSASDSLPPRKPPRQGPDKKISGRNGVNEMMQSSHHTMIIQEDSNTNQSGQKDKEIIRDLEMQLVKRNNEIEMLIGLKKSLQDENWRLMQYIETIVTRAISICPEVLCSDDSHA